jgi:hypothetical protein
LGGAIEACSAAGEGEIDWIATVIRNTFQLTIDWRAESTYETSTSNSTDHLANGVAAVVESVFFGRWLGFGTGTCDEACQRASRT